MKILLFDAPAHHILVEGGREIHGGDEFPVEDGRALDLLTQMGLPVREVPTPDDLMELTRAQLNELAAESGVEDPDSLRSKREVIDAIHQPLAADQGTEPIPDGEPDADAEPEPQEA